MFETVVFYVFAAILLLSALRVITARNPVHGALALVLAFFTAAGIWLLLRAEFLAITLVLVYVGAVMVLFLFVVMMLDVDLERLREGFWKNLPMAVVVGGIMAFEMVAVLAQRYFGAAARTRAVPADYSNTRELGSVLYTQYVYAFEIAAVILLVAIIAAIALTLRRRKDTKSQDPVRQVAARRAARVRLVSMPAEKER
jgi:NADH-quinone oxidoreductase subunit J